MPAMVARLTSSAMFATPLMLTFAVQTAAMGAPIGAWEKSSTDSVVALQRASRHVRYKRVGGEGVIHIATLREKYMHA